MSGPCWFNLPWSKKDRELLIEWKSNIGNNVRDLSEEVEDKDYTIFNGQVLNLIEVSEALLYLKENKINQGLSVKTGARGRPLKQRRKIPDIVRKFVLEQKGYRCEECQNGDIRLLQIDHDDGDPSNNEISNLKVRCYVCHKAKHAEAAKKKRKKSIL